MGQPQDVNDKPKGADVDIDEIVVEILIVAKDVNKLKSTAAFLSRRGWPTTVLNDVQKAISYIAEKRPDFVMIAVDHPNPMFARLPDLILTSFNIECIGFAEGSGNVATQKLNNSRLRNKIFGQPSGPNCQRTLRRLLAEKFDLQSDERAHEQAGSDEDANVTVRGGAGEKAGVETSDSSLNANSAANVVKGERQSAALPSDGVVSNGKYRIATSASPRKSLKELTGNATPNADESSARALEVMQSLGGEAALAADYESTLAPGDVAPAAALATAPLASEITARTSATAPAFATPRVMNVLEAAVVDAMNRFASTGPSDGEPLRLNATGRVAVFPLDSQTWPGYLVIAMQYSDLIDEKHVIDSVHGELAEALRRHGVEAKVESGLAVDLPFVEFKSWAAENALFSFCPVYYSYEFGVAFFKAPHSLPKAQALEESNMFGIDVKAISTEEPVNFKAYLHMRKNQKYFLYLRSGRRLQKEQKARLLGKQVDNLYMKSVDLENLRVFLAGNYLRDSMKKKSS